MLIAGVRDKANLSQSVFIGIDGILRFIFLVEIERDKCIVCREPQGSALIFNDGVDAVYVPMVFLVNACKAIFFSIIAEKTSAVRYRPNAMFRIFETACSIVHDKLSVFLIIPLEGQ